MSIVKIWAITIVFIILGVGIYLVAPSITPFFVAMFFAYIIHPFVLWLQKRLKLRHKVFAVILALLFISTVLGVIINAIFQVISPQAMLFVGEFNYLVAQAEHLLDFPEQMGLDGFIASQVEEILRQFLVILSTFIVTFITATLGFILGFADVIIILILLFLFLLDGPKLAQNTIARMPEVLREAASNFFKGIHEIVWGYLKTMVLISICFGIVFGLILYIIGVPFAGLLGVLGAILNMIPFIGSIISGAIAIIIALLYLDFYRVLIAAILIIALNAIQGGVIAPIVLANKLRIHPIFVIGSLLVCNFIWGVPGMFIAVPVLGLGRLLMQETFGVIRKL